MEKEQSDKDMDSKRNEYKFSAFMLDLGSYSKKD